MNRPTARDPADSFDFLIVGAGRGGTSLLTGLLGAHPRLEVGFEAFAVDCLMGLGLEVPSAEVKEDLAAYRAAEFERKCVAEAARHPGKLWGNKITTEQVHGLEDHNLVSSQPVDAMKVLFLDHLAGRKVLFVLRDGRACVRSKVRRTGQPVELAIARWKYSLAILRFLRRRHPQLLTTKFEDLVTAPRETLERICAFLEIDFSEEMLSGTNSRVLPPEYRRRGFDTTVLSTSGLPASANALMLEDLRLEGYVGGLGYLLARLAGSRWTFVALTAAVLLSLVVWAAVAAGLS